MTDSSDDAGAARAAQRTVVLLGAALIAVLIGTIVIAVDRVTADEDSPTIAADSPGDEGGSASRLDRVGPAPDTDLAAYVVERQRALEHVSDDAVAVVSFTEYLTEVRAAEVVEGLRIGAWLVALPGGPPASTGAVDEWRDEQVGDARDERAALEELLPTVDDPEFQSFYAAEIERLSTSIGGAERPLVHGVVVRGSGDRLRAVGADPVVRLVDAVDEAGLGPSPEFVGLRPEEQSRAGEPPFRP